MAVDLGDIYPLSINIYDADGNLANAGAVALTITLPDGTTSSVPSVLPTETGVYDYDYATVQVGKHTARWVATGANASAHVGTFYVNPTDTGEFISLPHFKAHIKKEHNRDDEIIRTFIAGACAVINDRVGQVAPLTFVQDVETVNGYARLDKWPVISITSVQGLPGLVAVSEANKATGAPGWTLSDGYTPLYIGTSGWYRVTYRAGRINIPQNYILAALELTKHLWQTSQQNPGGGRPPTPNDEMIIQGTTFAMPYNVRQLLGLDKRPRTDVFVG